LESEIKVLQSQINPHFLSNSLMSLQSIVLENDKEKACEFIGQYGSVMRSVLEKSNYSFISLDQEILTLKEYIKLEALIRGISIDFEFSFNSDNTNLNMLNINVPTMIFQPFIENSIIHGLIPKNSETKTLRFIATIKNKKLLVKIIDNGVGLLKKETKRKSYGLENIQNRLKAYSELLKTKSYFTIEDIKEGTEFSSGSQVIIYMPYILK
jgi:LytS/YehU family sensor histidine kinase